MEEFSNSILVLLFSIEVLFNSIVFLLSSIELLFSYFVLILSYTEEPLNFIEVKCFSTNWRASQFRFGAVHF